MNLRPGPPAIAELQADVLNVGSDLTVSERASAESEHANYAITCRACGSIQSPSAAASAGQQPSPAAFDLPSLSCPGGLRYNQSWYNRANIRIWYQNSVFMILSNARAYSSIIPDALVLIDWQFRSVHLLSVRISRFDSCIDQVSIAKISGAIIIQSLRQVL